MKIITKKIFYTQDWYYIPNRGGGYFSAEGLKDFSPHIRKLAEIQYKKGDFKKWHAEVKPFCCNELEESESKIGAEDSCENSKTNAQLGCWLPFQGYDEPDYTLINYCPFCGEKIEVIEGGNDGT